MLSLIKAALLIAPGRAVGLIAAVIDLLTGGNELKFSARLFEV